MVFVLDTSSVLSDPDSLQRLSSYHIVIPMTTILELESKRHHSYLGYPARRALRAIEELRVRGSLKEGVETESGGSIRVEFDEPDFEINDDKILAVAKNIEDATLLSEDLPLRLKADIMGVQTSTIDQAVDDLRPVGEVITLQVESAAIDRLYSHGMTYIFEAEDLPIHTPIILRCGTQSALGRINADGQVQSLRSATLPIESKNVDQKFAIDALTNNNVRIVSLGGAAGSGKTLLALASAFSAIDSRENRYDKIIVFRPVEAVGGQELGFLPGTEEEKMNPWAAAISDAMKAFMPSHEVATRLRARDIEVLPLTHIRGRTFRDCVIIVDEAQNLDLTTLVTAISRVGENSKIILTHDVSQRDNVKVGKYDGIHKIIEKLSGEELFMHISLNKSERSEVAELVSRSFGL